jgi:ABC-2 type transport system ATP-binding protein
MPDDPSVVVHADMLGKTYPPRSGWRRLQRQLGTTAVRDVSLTVYAGELFGLLGPNGAGKTTLAKLLCTLILPTNGRGSVGGHDLSQSQAIRAVTGLVVADERSFYWRLSVQRNLQFFAAMHHLHGAEAAQRIDEVLEAVQLRDRTETRFSDLSTGMRQRVAIARGLLHRPKILFLDEPTRSLDPVSTADLHQRIRELMQVRGMTVFLITHDLHEAEKLCSRVAVMHQGRVRAVGSPDDLRRQVRPQRRYTLTLDAVSPAALGALEPLVSELHTSNGLLHFTIPELRDHLSAILDLLRSHDTAIHAIESRTASLEELFAHLTADDA